MFAVAAREAGKCSPWLGHPFLVTVEYYGKGSINFWETALLSFVPRCFLICKRGGGGGNDLSRILVRELET